MDAVSERETAPQGDVQSQARTGDAKPAKRHNGPGVWIARGLIRTYQLTLAPFVGRHCRYLPTCSHYAEDAIVRHGFWAGGWMALARLCRCHPFGASGFDPVPDQADHSGGRWWRPWAFGRWTGRHIDPNTRLDR